MSDKKQSSIDWIADKLDNLIPSGNQIAIHIILTQAQSMHRQEIEDAFHVGADNMNNCISKQPYISNGQDYFEQTFKTY